MTTDSISIKCIKIYFVLYSVSFSVGLWTRDGQVGIYLTRTSDRSSSACISGFCLRRKTRNDSSIKRIMDSYIWNRNIRKKIYTYSQYESTAILSLLPENKNDIVYPFWIFYLAIPTRIPFYSGTFYLPTAKPYL